MASPLPQFEVNRFASIGPITVIRAYLLKTKSTISLKALQSNLKASVPPEPLDRAAKQLITEGHASLEGNKLRLAKSGIASARAIMGDDLSKPWTHIRNQRLPILALGLNANDPEIRRKLAKDSTPKGGHHRRRVWSSERSSFDAGRGAIRTGLARPA